MARPSTATARKLTELLMRKKATEPAGAAGRHERAHADLGEPDLQARAPRHARAEDGPEHEHVRARRQGLEHEAEHEPARARVGEVVADLAQAGREGDDEQEDADEEDDLQRAAREAARIDVAGEPGGGCRHRPIVAGAIGGVPGRRSAD
jgi:hypothetical protein